MYKSFNPVSKRKVRLYFIHWVKKLNFESYKKKWNNNCPFVVDKAVPPSMELGNPRPRGQIVQHVKKPWILPVPLSATDIHGAPEELINFKRLKRMKPIKTCNWGTSYFILHACEWNYSIELMSKILKKKGVKLEEMRVGQNRRDHYTNRSKTEPQLGADLKLHIVSSERKALCLTPTAIMTFNSSPLKLRAWLATTGPWRPDTQMVKARTSLHLQRHLSWNGAENRSGQAGHRGFNYAQFEWPITACLMLILPGCYRGNRIFFPLF